MAPGTDIQGATPVATSLMGRRVATIERMSIKRFKVAACSKPSWPMPCFSWIRTALLGVR
eukprot:12901741-Alexandrium_andersonii.AAC.1